MSFRRGGGGDRRGDRTGRRPDDWRPFEPRSRDRDRNRDRDRDRERPFPSRRFDRGDDGGMSIRLDPRRLAALKTLAGEAGMRPGELVLRWVEERIDAERRGERAGALPTAGAADAGLLGDLRAGLDALAARVAALEGAGPSMPVPIEVAAESQEASVSPRRRGRPRTSRAAGRDGSGPRVPLHEEILAVIGERGPLTAAEIAAAINERGRYAPPRSGKPLDAATVNGRVSNPVYRARFRREDGRIAPAPAAGD